MSIQVSIVHGGIKTFECNVYRKTFSNNVQLKHHLKSRQHKCDSCGRSFTRADHLRGHIKTIHEGRKDFKCDSCGRSFTQPNHLKTHIKTFHEGHKDFKCDSCGRLFTQPNHLKRHIKTIHEGRKDSNVTLVANYLLMQISYTYP